MGNFTVSQTGFKVTVKHRAVSIMCFLEGLVRTGKIYPEQELGSQAA